MTASISKFLLFTSILCLPTVAVSASDIELKYSLDRCIAIALENNQRQSVSQFAVAMAEAQHQQALSGYWPQVTLSGLYNRTDEPLNFIYPERSFSLPASTAFVTVPAGVLGPSAVSLPVNVPAQSLNVPSQEIELADRDSFASSLDLQWLVYDGGMRQGLRKQSGAGLQVAREGVRRTELEIIDSVTRTYYGAVLARQIYELGLDTLSRMETTLSLTESLYREGAGTVKKTDFLENKVVVESIRSLVANLDKNQQIARAALANQMGLPWRTCAAPEDTEIVFSAMDFDLEDLVASAYQFSPDWRSLDAGLDAANGALKFAASGYKPKMVVTGKVHRFWNEMEDGLASDENKKGWSVGLGIEIPIFDGFLTRNKVRYARAKLHQLESQKILLYEGIGLQVKDIALGLDMADAQYAATLAAMEAATENRSLNERAYRNDLVETEDVIQAQLVEALMTAQHFKVCFDHVQLKSKLNLLVGQNVLDILSGETAR